MTIRNFLAAMSSTAILSFSATSATIATITFVSQVQMNRYIFSRTNTKGNYPFYDYAPDLIYEHGVFHLFWCGGVPDPPTSGDHILHAQSTSLLGPYHSSWSSIANSYDVSLTATGSPTGFDGQHTCDPAVLKIGSTYYLYYGGLAKNNTTSGIGVASSIDGIHFSRLNGGSPIVQTAETGTKPYASTYGVGEPTVFLKNGYIYLGFTDTTGSGVQKSNGAGQFVLRSTDPSFQKGVEELTKNGWVAREAGVHTAEYSVLNAFSMDWMFDPLTGTIIAASNEQKGSANEPSSTYIFVIDPARFTIVADLMKLKGTWRDGPGLLKQSDRTSMPRAACDLIDLAVAEGNSPNVVYSDTASWDISLSEGTFRLDPSLCVGVKD